MKLQSKTAQNILLNCFFLVIAIIFLYPLIWIIASAFKTTAQMWDSSVSLLPKPFVVANFIRAWKTANFSIYFINTIIFSFSVVVLTIMLAGTSGYVLGRYNFKLKKVILGLLLITLVIPRATTIIPLFTIAHILGLLNLRLGYILAYLGQTLVIAIMLFIGFFTGVPKELDESALMEGANFPQVFFYIIMPLSKPVIATVAITNAIGTWKAFMIPLVFTFSKPELRTLGVGMYAFVGEHATDWTGMAAAAVISLFPMMLIFIFFQRYFIQGLAGAVKG